MLVRRRRRRANIEPALVQCLVFAGAQRYNTALQGHKAVPAYLWSKKILPFGFARQNMFSDCKNTPEMIFSPHFTGTTQPTHDVESMMV